MTTGVKPTENTTDPATSMASGDATSSTRARSPKPAAETAIPPAITYAGWNRRTIMGVSMDPAMKASVEGRPHSPASNGDKPKTDCKYSAMNRNAANVVEKPRTFTTSAALTEGSGIT